VCALGEGRLQQSLCVFCREGGSLCVFYRGVMVLAKSWMKAVMPATFTPGADVPLASTIAAMQQWLAQEGVMSAYVNGTTGEFPSQSIQTRKDALQAWVDAAKRTPEFKVVAHIGHCNVADAIDMAKHAAEIGADAIAAVPPWFFRYANAQHVANVIAEIAAAAPDLPFLYYHIPMFTKVATGTLEKNFFGDGIYLSEILDLCQKQIPNFAGCKYTSQDFTELARVDAVRKTNPEAERFVILIGGDHIFLRALEEIGIEGAIGSAWNLVRFSAELWFSDIFAFIVSQGWSDFVQFFYQQ
jgi:N-acetylneuraminate lyase